MHQKLKLASGTARVPISQRWAAGLNQTSSRDKDCFNNGYLASWLPHDMQAHKLLGNHVFFVSLAQRDLQTIVGSASADFDHEKKSG